MELSNELTIQSLKDLAKRTSDTVVWTDVSAWVVDALRGSIHEVKWRGTLTEYFEEYPEALGSRVERAAARLASIQPTPSTDSNESKLWGSIGLGTYGWKYDPEVIKRAHTLGVCFIDTAETYGYGRVEAELGRVFEETAYTPIVATKFSRSHMSYQAVINAATRSRRRLGLGKIGLYQAHWPSPGVPTTDTVRAMDELVQDGWVTWLGVCNHSVDQIITVMSHLGRKIDAVQVRYNLQDRGIEHALLPWCKDEGILVIAYSPLGQNFRKFLGNDVGDVLGYVAGQYDASPVQIALAWILTHDGVIPIPRTNNPDHVNEIVDASQIKLEPGHVELLEEAFPVTE